MEKGKKMISKVKQENRGSVKIAEYIGLSTDDKTNLDGCVNGSTILYMDTNKIAIYDAEHKQWYVDGQPE